MTNLRMATMLAVLAAATGCNRAERGVEPVANVDTEAADAKLKERIDDTAELEKRVVDVTRRWTEMQAEVREENRSPTAALRAEVKEDVANIQAAVANLKTTTDANWWERHEQATLRTLDDVEADVRRFTKTAPAPAAIPAEPAATTGSFETGRDEFVRLVRARVDNMEERLKDIKADGARETELQDTRARIDKLQEDLDRLRTVSPEEWWDVSAERVDEYVDRVERSISRLNDDKK